MKTDAQEKSSVATSPTSRTKKVRFADLVGLKLEFVKTITPCSSEDNLCDLCNVVGEWENHCAENNNVLWVSRMKCLLPCFVAPSRIDGFMERVQNQNVCLENIACENFVVTGIIRVNSLCYMKKVTVRFTLDGWATYQDILADYMSSCLDGKTDKFCFRIRVPTNFDVNQHLHFAVRYRVSNQEFWDNNNGKNYHLQCVEVRA